MPRSLTFRYGLLLALAIAAPSLSVAAEQRACKPQKIVRYLDVEVAVTPHGGAPDSQVTLLARCLPAERPVVIWSGQAFDAVRPVSTGSIDALGSFSADATVPADAEPGESYYFAVMIDDHIVGTGSYLVDGEGESTAQ